MLRQSNYGFESVQYISGWLFEKNGAIGRYFKITLTIILLSWSLTIGLVVCVILASIDLIPISPLLPKQPT